MSRKFRRILVVDDDERIRRVFECAVREDDRAVYLAADRAEAMEVAREMSPDLVLVDLRLRRELGLEVLRDIKQLLPDTTVVVMSAFLSVSAAEAALLGGAARVVDKAIGFRAILAKVEGERSPTIESDGPPTLARAEWEYIDRVLYEVGGNITAAARCLGIPRSTLQRKRKKDPPPR